VELNRGYACIYGNAKHARSHTGKSSCHVDGDFV
jgi:hypothetical protein